MSDAGTWPYSDEQLAAMDRTAIAAALDDHLKVCDACNYDTGESCPCQWVDEEVAQHNCACPDGPGNGHRLIRAYNIATRGA